MPLHKRHRITARKHISHKETEELPRGVKLLAWARTMRWIGWGWGESLVPIFLFAFAASYAETGLLSSVFEIALLISLPIVGMLADRMSAKILVVIGLVLYPLVGIGYFLAGATGVAVFVVLSRVINGVAWAFEGTGLDTYYRRVTDRNHLASSFGYVETVAYAGWIAAALLSMFLVTFVPIHYLLLLIAPCTLLALPIALLAPKDPVHRARKKMHTLESYKNVMTEWGSWDTRLKLLGVLVLFMGIIDTLVNLFIPIDAFIEGASFQLIVLLSVIPTIPRLFGFSLGKIADRYNKYILLVFALGAVALLMTALAVFSSYIAKLIVSFLLGIVMELFTVIGKSLVTTLGPQDRYGIRGSTFESIATVGNLGAPLIIGISFDALGFGLMASVLAGAAVLLGLAFGAVGRHHKRN